VAALRVFLVEPWLGGSHQAWAEGYAACSRHDVHVVGLGDAHWRWRLRGGAVTLAEQVADLSTAVGRPDVVLASSMLDLAAFLGHCRRSLGDAAVCLYLHETQPARTRLTGEPLDDDVAHRNWSSMVVADHTFVNSGFHRRKLFEALPALLQGAPDHRHTHLVAPVEARTTVLPVGVDVEALVAEDRPVDDGGAPLVLWNHRWDHDKAPEVFFRALRRLDHDGVAFRLALAGANVRRDPREFAEAEERFGDRLVHVGHLDRTRYLELLLRSSVVASTAVHEFFGIAMVEAMAAGAVPFLPRALSYPELVPSEFHDAVLYESYGDLVRRLREALVDLDAARQGVDGLRKSMLRFDWTELGPRYDASLAAVLAGSRPEEVPL
jgi:glycosyltransferase involved in cell wall biosynthesis